MMRVTAALAAAAMILGGSALAQKKSEPKGREMTVTGCLTKGSRTDTFHLTPMPDSLASALAVATAGEVHTVHYELVGGTDLHKHVGHKVEVTGRVDRKVLADAEHEERHTVTTDPSNKKAPTARVEVTEDIEIKLRRMHVKSTRMMADTCK